MDAFFSKNLKKIAQKKLYIKYDGINLIIWQMFKFFNPFFILFQTIYTSLIQQIYLKNAKIIKLLADIKH